MEDLGVNQVEQKAGKLGGEEARKPKAESSKGEAQSKKAGNQEAQSEEAGKPGGEEARSFPSV